MTGTEQFIQTVSGGGGGGGVTNQPSITSFAATVPVPGTAVQLSSQALENGIAVVVRAKPGNTGSIWVGGSSGEAEDHANAYELESGDLVWYYVTNTNAIYIDADVADEGVNCTMEIA